VARKCKEDDDVEKALKKEMEEQKGALVDALERQAEATLALAEAGAAGAGLEDADRDMGLLREWVDTAEDAKYLGLHARWELLAGRAAQALRCIDRKVKEDAPTPSRETLETRAKVLEALGWTYWAEKQRGEILDRFPASYPLF